MGIKGLFNFIRKCEIIVDISTYVFNKEVAIDIFGYIHRSKGSIDIIYEQLAPFHTAKKIVAVFDGQPSEERSKLNEDHRLKNSIIKDTIKVLQETYVDKSNSLSNKDRVYLKRHIEELENQCWTPSPKFVGEVKKLLTEMGIECAVQEKGVEADFALEKYINYVIVTNDSDMLINCKTVLRSDGHLYLHNKILEDLELSENEWLTFIHICKTMIHTDCEIAFSLVKIYRDYTIIKEKFGHLWQ